MRAKVIKIISETQTNNLTKNVLQSTFNNNIKFNDCDEATILDVEIQSVSKLGDWRIIVEQDYYTTNSDNKEFVLIVFFKGRRESFKNGCYYCKWNDKTTDIPKDLSIFGVNFNIDANDFNIETSMPNKPLFTVINNNKSVWQKIVNYLF